MLTVTGWIPTEVSKVEFQGYFLPQDIHVSINSTENRVFPRASLFDELGMRLGKALTLPTMQLSH